MKWPFYNPQVHGHCASAAAQAFEDENSNGTCTHLAHQRVPGHAVHSVFRPENAKVCIYTLAHVYDNRWIYYFVFRNAEPNSDRPTPRLLLSPSNIRWSGRITVYENLFEPRELCGRYTAVPVMSGVDWTLLDKQKHFVFRKYVGTYV